MKFNRIETDLFFMSGLNGINTKNDKVELEKFAEKSYIHRSSLQEIACCKIWFNLNNNFETFLKEISTNPIGHFFEYLEDTKKI